MKKIILLLCLSPLSLWGKDLELKTAIRDVTVFTAGAQVNRTGYLLIPAGEHEIKIKDATPLLKKESLQVRTDADITILSVNHQVNYDDQELSKTRNTELEIKKKELQRSSEDLIAKFSVLQAEENIIGNLQYISTTTQGVTVEQVVKAQEMLRLKMNAIMTEQLSVKRQLDQIAENLQNIMQQIVALNISRQTVSYEVVIKVLATKETKADFEIGYIVPNARWFPSYDIRVKNVGEPMLIEYKANVMQNSGENWENVKIKLSTGDPSRSSRAPQIQPWYLQLNQSYQSPIPQSNYYQYTDSRYVKVKGVVYSKETGEPLKGSVIMVNGTNVGTTSDSEGKFALTLPQNGNALTISFVGYQNQSISVNDDEFIVYMEPLKQQEEIVVAVDKRPEIVFSGNGMGYADGAIIANEGTSQLYYASPSMMMNATSLQEVEVKSIRKTRSKKSGQTQNAQPQVSPQLNIVNAEFVIEEKYSIPSNQQSYTVQIQSILAPAQYQYYCAPRLDKDVFLTARMSDWEQYNFLEGQANVFFENTFIGNTLLDTKFLKDTLDISLGRDKGVRVERKKVKEYSKRQFIGNDQTTSRQWDITVRNGKNKAIDIIIEDQFPLSSVSSIEVKREEKSGGSLNDQTGVVTWKIKLEPGQNNQFKLMYSVKHPKGTFIGLD
ncbi:MAG: mucoidy inhibitor MuiA family protein [Flavobacteriales bacterium]|nr:mucoidy inhibitor MuiA family protein [Flavobacteriales bacterium]